MLVLIREMGVACQQFVRVPDLPWDLDRWQSCVQFTELHDLTVFRAEEFENDNRTEVPKKEKPPLTLHLQCLPLH